MRIATLVPVGFVVVACGSSGNKPPGTALTGGAEGGAEGGTAGGTEGGTAGGAEGGTDVGPEGGTAGGVSVSVSPTSVAVLANASQSFTCTVTGSANTSCTWKVSEANGGTITAAGAYTAPAATGTYHVVGTSVGDAEASATATVTVVAQQVGGCSNLAAAGTWQNITPPSLNWAEWCAPYNTGCPQPTQTANGKIGTYGTNAFVLDPVNVGTVYLGTSSLGIWKSTDCGSTWAHVDTGTNGANLDAGRNWSMLIDPTNSQILYTVAGYAPLGGVYKSTDGGVNWAQVLTQNVLDATGASPCATTADKTLCGNFGGNVEKITMDPTNNQHLLASFHNVCAGTTPLPGATPNSQGDWGCLAESTDSGTTWTLTTSAMPWTGTDGPGQTMIDATTWFYGTNSTDGLWRTTTGGVSVNGAPAWTEVLSTWVNGSVYVATNGVFFVGGYPNVDWSKDGITWTPWATSPSATSINGSTPMVDDGTTFYTGTGPLTNATYWTAPLMSQSAAFTQISSTPGTPQSSTAVESPIAWLQYDSAHHLLYSSNLDGGFWRYVTQ